MTIYIRIWAYYKFNFKPIGLTTPPSILDISSLPPQTAVTKKFSKLKPPSKSTIPPPTKAMIPLPTEATEPVQSAPTRIPTTTPSLAPTSQPPPPNPTSEAPKITPPTTTQAPQQTTTKNIGKIDWSMTVLLIQTSETTPKSTVKPFVAAEPTEGPKLSPQTLFSTKGKWFHNCGKFLCLYFHIDYLIY